MRIDIVTLFPELCDGFLSTSILGRARAKNLFEAHCHQIRDYTKNKQRQTDDYPYGGGCGMVLYAQPIADCLRAVADQCAQQGRAKPHVVFLTAAGQPYNEETAKRLEILNHSNDGFYIASEDLKLRGSGDLLGTRQSGDMEFQMADIFRDADILQKASEAASELLADDPYFEKPEHELLKKVMKSYLDLENHDIGL